MSQLHEALADALRDRRAIIADREAYLRDPSAHLDRLKAVSGEIASLEASLPLPVPPQLAHYLNRCSYDKALAFLEQNECS